MSDDIIRRAESIVAASDPAETIELTLTLRISNERLMWRAYRAWADIYGLEMERSTTGALSDIFTWWMAGLPGVELLQSGRTG